MTTFREAIGPGNSYLKYKEADTTFEQILRDYVFFAFSEEQFKEGLKKLKPLMKPGEKLTSIGFGGYVVSSKADELFEADKNKGKLLRSKMRTKKFAKDAFLYELGNHEYQFWNGQNDWDVIRCFGECEWGRTKNAHDYLDEIGLNDAKIHAAWDEAREEYMELCLENDWF